jgi:hypothetical protein
MLQKSFTCAGYGCAGAGFDYLQPKVLLNISFSVKKISFIKNLH